MTKENAHLYLPFVQALADGKTVEYLEGNLWRSFTNLEFSSSIENYRIKPEHALVPLGPEDVPPGSVIRRREWSNAWQLIDGVYARSISFNKILLDWDKLIGVYEIKCPGEDWKPCSKLAS